MKKIIIFLMLLILSSSSFSQEVIPSQPYSRDDYLKKSKEQKTTGWIVFSGGVALGTISAITILTNSGSYTSVLGICLGGVITIFSVPFFNAAVHNKEKAIRLSFKNESAPLIQKSSFIYRSVPSLTLKITL